MNRETSDRLFLHGIGSRGEGVVLHVAEHFADDLRCINYEPDSGAIEQTSDFYRSRGIGEVTYPVAVSSVDGTVEVNLNYDPFTASILEGNPDYKDFYCRYDLPNGDYPLGEVFAPVKRVTVPSVRLDTWCAKHGLGLDYASIDTQGCEPQVLEGMGALIDSELLALTVEVEYHPLYKGQGLFDSILDVTRRHGFHMIRAINHPPGSFFRGPLGWRGTGVTISGDVMFFKDIRRILRDHAAPRRSLYKMAFLALCFDNVEYALDCLVTLDRLPLGKDVASDRPYVVFLNGLRSLYEADIKIYPPTFADLFSAEESFARFEPGGRVDGYDIDHLRQRYFARTDPATLKAGLPALLDPAPSAVENYLSSHGFISAAGIVNANRLKGARMTAIGLGLAQPGTIPDPAGVAAALEMVSLPGETP